MAHWVKTRRQYVQRELHRPLPFVLRVRIPSRHNKDHDDEDEIGM